MMTKKLGILFAAMSIGSLGAFGCSSSDGNNDGAVLDGSTDDGSLVLFGLSTGDSCFDVVSVTPGFNDGCDIGVGDTAATGGPVGGALLVNYVQATATVTVGTAGSLGAGPVARNMGTLTRENDTSSTAMPTCTWHQKDTSLITITATNKFTLSVTEVESNFATVCNPPPPTSGTCTSTWTWTMQKTTSTTLTPPACK